MKILLLHFGQLGDAVMGLPAALALRRHFPEAQVTVLASGGGDAIYRLAGFATVWTADRMGWKRAPWTAPGALAGLLVRLRREKFDLAVDLHSFQETNLLAWAAGIPRRVAMLRRTRSYPRLITEKPPWDRETAHLIDRYCDVLLPLGIAVPDRVPALTPPPGAVFTAAAPVLGICPGAGNPTRRWPPERFAAVVGQLQADAGFATVVFAGPEESDDLLAPFAALPHTRVLRGLSIPQLAAGLAACHLVLTNPTGPSHIAAAVGARVLTLGEIPPFDPAAHYPGQVTVVRADSTVAEIAVPAVVAAARRAWHGG